MPIDVSVVIPARNASRTIKRTIDCAIMATAGLNSEVIVVDDKSEDQTSSVAKQSGVVVLEGRGRGASAARNLGTHHARGQWIQYLDADDELDPQKIKDQLQDAEQFGPEFLYTSRWRRRFSCGREEIGHNVTSMSRTPPEEWLIAKYRERRMAPVHSWLLSRALFRRVGGWREDLSRNDDGHFFDRAVLASCGVILSSGGDVTYNISESSTVSTCSDRHAMRSLVISIEEPAMQLLRRLDDQQARSAIYDALMRVAEYSLPYDPDSARHAANLAELCAPDKSWTIHGGLLVTTISRVFGWRSARTVQFGLRKMFGKRDVAVV